MHTLQGCNHTQKKVFTPFQVCQSPEKRSLVDSEELQSYTALPIWGNSSLGEELVRGDNPLLGVIIPQDSER